MFNFFNRKEKKKTKEKSVFEVSTLDTVKELISDVVGDIDKGDIYPEAELENLGLDSIKFLNILLAFEDILEMDLEDIVEKIDLSTIQTVQDVINLIDKLKNNKV